MGQAISAAAQAMLADAKAMVGTAIDTSPLLGTWINTTRDTDRMVKAVLTEKDGAVSVRLYGASTDGLVDWGESDVIPYVSTGTDRLAGFYSRYVLGTTAVEIAAMLKHGLLVLHVYSSFHDDSRRLSQFSQELYYRSEKVPEPGPVRAGRGALAGDWVNTRPDTEWIREFTLSEKENGYTIRVHAVNAPTDWGETEIVTFLDGSGGPAFRAEYDLGSINATLGGNTGKSGIIVVSAFVQRKDDESTNAFCREVFLQR